MNSTEVSSSHSTSFLSNLLSPITIFYFLILIISVAGNVLVLSAVCFKPRFSRPANFMLANLCVTSLLQVSALLVALLLKNYPVYSFGPWTCRLYPILYAFAVPAEGFTVMCISLERSQVSSRPLERESRRKVVKNVLGIWIISLFIELPHVVFWKYTQDAPTFLKCVNTKKLYGSTGPYLLYACSYFFVAFILPTCFMLREALLLGSRLKFLISSVQAEWSPYQLSKYKLTRNALVFIVIFICLKLPVSSIDFVTRMPPGFFPQSVTDWATDWKIIFYRIGAFNVTIYPLMIFALSNKLRELFGCFPQAPRRSAPQALELIPVRLQLNAVPG